MPSVIGTPVETVVTGTATPAFDYDATVNAGELLIYHVTARNNTSETQAINTPTGLTRLQDGGGAGFQRAVAVFSKIADGTEGGTTITFVMDLSNNHRCTITRFSGAGGVDISSVASGFPSTGAFDGPALGEPSVNNCLILQLLSHQSLAANPEPSGYTQIYLHTNTQTANVAASLAQTTAASISAQGWDTSGDAGDSHATAFALAIAPAAASGPTIDTQPTNQTVTAPATATFTVAATAGSGSLTYQWEVNTGSGYSNVSTGTGGTTASYTTAATTTDMTGYLYRCQVTDDGGTVASDAATLTVNAAVLNPGITSDLIKEPNLPDTNVDNASNVTVRVWHGATITGAPDEVLTDQSVTSGRLEFEVTGPAVGAAISYQARWLVGGADRFFEVLNVAATDLDA